MSGMNHHHVRPPHIACTLCFVEARHNARQEDERSRRFWRRILLGFFLAAAGVVAFVLFKIGTMGR